MLNFTFAELLQVFFRLRFDTEKIKTQDDLAKAIGVSRRTVAGWFAGDYVPRSPKFVEQLAYSLQLTVLQTDLLLYSVNSKWTKYNTPHAILEATELVRYKEERVRQKPLEVVAAAPSPTQVEREWSVYFEDSFDSNYQRWGLGVKQNGMCQVERVMQNNRYILSLQNQYHDDVFMGGDSSCFAPEIYYLTVTAKIINGETEDDGYGIMFEEISDESFALFRVREKMQKVSVVQTFDGVSNYSIYVNKAAAPSIRVNDVNKLAILAMHNNHWFYINNVLVAHCSIARLPHARLDVAVIAGRDQHVTCHYHHICVRVPPAAYVYMN